MKYRSDKTAKKYDDTKYVLSTARIRAMEGRMFSKEALERVIAAKNDADICRILSEYGCRTVTKKTDGIETVDIEATLSTLLSDAYREIEEMMPETDSVRFLRYKYDCLNVKTAMKCRIRNISCDGILNELGCVAPDKIIEAVNSSDYSCLPENMAAGASLAYGEYLKTGDVQKIDLMIDKACFDDMYACAKKSGVPMALSYVKAEIDITNIIIAVRVLCMNNGKSDRQLLELALADGGDIDKEFLAELAEKGQNELWSTLAKKGYYREFVGNCSSRSSFTEIEIGFDRYIMTMLKESKWVSFGAEPAIAYILGLEYAIKNVRIVLAGKASSSPEGVVKERLRDMYV